MVSFREGNQEMTYKHYFFPYRKKRDDLPDASAVDACFRDRPCPSALSQLWVTTSPLQVAALPKTFCKSPAGCSRRC